MPGSIIQLNIIWSLKQSYKLCITYPPEYYLCYELTSNDGTSIDISCGNLWYELTSISGTSWHGYELTWVRVDIYCVVIDVNSYHHLILAFLGTSWNLMVVRVDITCGRSWHLLVVRVDMGTSWHGYELTWVRVDMGTSWPVFLYYTALQSQNAVSAY